MAGLSSLRLVAQAPAHVTRPRHQLLWVAHHPQAVGGVGSTGSPVANALARDADLVIGVGTRYSDFTTASRTAFQNPDVKFVNINVASFDAYKHGSQLPVIADHELSNPALHTKAQ